MEQSCIEAQKLEQNRYNCLAENYIALQRVIEERPPRPEDLDLIEMLKKELADCQGQLKYLAIEVIGKEEMYNKIFTSKRDLQFLSDLKGRLNVVKAK